MTRLSAACLLSAALCVLLFACAASGARVEQQQLELFQQAPAEDQPRQNTLLTYYFDATKPVVEISTRASGRSGRTGLTVKLTEQSVSSFMPVVSPQPSGMTHQVAQTWNALKVRRGRQLQAHMGAQTAQHSFNHRQPSRSTQQGQCTKHHPQQ